MRMTDEKITGLRSMFLTDTNWDIPHHSKPYTLPYFVDPIKLPGFEPIIEPHILDPVSTPAPVDGFDASDEDLNIVCYIPPFAHDPVPSPAPSNDPVGVHLDDGGFTMYIGPNGEIICGTPPKTEPSPPATTEPVNVQLLDDGGFTVYIGPNGEAVCGTPPTTPAPTDPTGPVGIHLDDVFTISIGEDGEIVCADPQPPTDPIGGYSAALDDVFTISINGDGEIVCADPVQQAIDDFVAPATDKGPSIAPNTDMPPHSYMEFSAPVIDLPVHIDAA